MKRTDKTTFKKYLYNAHIFENLHSLFNCMGIFFRCAAILQKMTKLQSKIEKVPGGIRGEKSSKDMASSRN